MSAHFDIGKISFFALDDWSVAVCAWRGCCLEVFSRAEHSVADCLRALEVADIPLPKDARNNFPTKRLKALSACIRSHEFGGHGKTALVRIAEWERLHETRALLAHGVIKANGDGMTICHQSYDGKSEKQLPPKRLTRLEMLQALAELEAAQVSLHQQLGHIKALAKTAKRKKPDPN